MIAGDINFHLNNIDDPDATTLKDTLHALGCKIHNNFPTQQHENTLDILATEIAGSLNIITCRPGPFFSDHCSIECTTNKKGRTSHGKEYHLGRLRTVIYRSSEMMLWTNLR